MKEINVIKSDNYEQNWNNLLFLSKTTKKDFNLISNQVWNNNSYLEKQQFLKFSKLLSTLFS